MKSCYKNKIKKEFLLFFLILIVSLFVLDISQSLATEVDWPSLPLPGGGQATIDDDTELNELVRYIFNFTIMIAGLLAFFMLVFGGFRYLTSAGNPAAQKDAKDILTSAILGLLLLLGSYLLLQVINPDILILKPISF